MTHKTKKIPIDIYNTFCFITITDGPVAENQDVRKALGDKISDNTEACCVCYDGGAYHLFFQKDTSLSIISHEVFHLTHFIMDTIGAKFDQESYAYLHAFLIKKVSDFFSKHKHSSVRLG